MNIERITEDMGSAWVTHVSSSAFHEYERHPELIGVMSRKEYADHRVIEIYNHYKTHLEAIRLAAGRTC